MYAIVDIETTGGHASGNGITEIAICIHNGKKVIERYSTLVNPRRDIPIYISALTGITNEMVENAPPFEDVAHDIYHLLNNKIFVAHNVNFDHSFVRHHLAAVGYELQCNKLCTVRLGRKIMPGLPSYGLGKLCRHLGIENESRHRAAGDAEATAKIFTLLLQQDKGNHIPQALKQNSKEQVLPANLPKQDVDALPQSPGVYYFHDQKGKVIYVGKAKNLKKRVCSHFTGNNPGVQRQEFLRNIHNITFQVCGTELVAFVLEAVEIKRLWPKYNRSLKRFEQTYSLYAFEDQRGYLRLAVDKHRKMTGSIYSCNTLFEGRSILLKLIDTFELCPKLCFIQSTIAECTRAKIAHCACEGHESVDDYNQKVYMAISELNKALPTFAIRDAGRTDDEHSCLLVEKGKFYGMGYISHYFNADTLDQLKNHLTPYPGNDYIRNMVDSYAVKYPDRKMVFAG
ncbi:GIY-YIG nuclease family protein [Mucilaginibacter sp. BJC16-A38]|uniref:exonuclease domain-containing protein n=1 Tax=Mucilaginibacter phenanthrenivorans TaxID=1234842 RepID=UPI0021589FCF|nr:exonuclease domain-containing protein [Mucilaginibacter phenanthrenivorans]MCR8559851.1 GIY-YIG nuclease family protein [Mucilaginibacter phenanthrenivorans]